MNEKEVMKNVGLVRDLKVEIPKVFLEEFTKNPQFIMKYAPPGYWPVPLYLLKESRTLSKLFSDKEFAANHEVVLMRK